MAADCICQEEGDYTEAKEGETLATFSYSIKFHSPLS